MVRAGSFPRLARRRGDDIDPTALQPTREHMVSHRVLLLIGVLTPMSTCGASSPVTIVNINLYSDSSCANVSYTERFQVGKCYNLTGGVHLKYELVGNCSKMREIRYTAANCTGQIGFEDTVPHVCHNFSLQKFHSYDKHCTVNNSAQPGERPARASILPAFAARHHERD
jgi:hypothetical protein